MQPGACLPDPAELDSAVACDTVHSAEVIATAGECSDAAAAEYMGGSSGTDVLSRIVPTEVVARLPAESSESLDCDAAASDYMARDISERFSEVTVEEISSDAARRCVVSVRSDGAWLRTPLRELGHGAIGTERS